MYRTLNAYLRETFGTKVYKLALHGASTCPNRDGTCGSRGCIFCTGSGEFAQSACACAAEQIALAKKRVEAKNPGGKYIAYFQDYTNTYDTIPALRERFFDAIAQPDIVALSIATRPDCLGSEVLALLRELRAQKPVWIELGLQSIHAETAAYIRRGYPLCVYDEAVKQLKAIGTEVITHMILGLPGESTEQMVQTARYIGQSGADGIKLQLLHVLRGTDLADEYARGAFEVLTLEGYIDILEACLRVLPPQMVIHRLTGDGDKKLLIAPLWSANKKAVLNRIHKRFLQDGLVQGSAL